MGTAELLILKKEVTTAEVKMSVQSRFTKVRWTLTVIGLVLYIVDIISDFFVGAKLLQEGNITWGILTIAFVLCASLCTQIFSYTWFRDDKTVPTVGDTGDWHVSWDLLTGLHVTQMGIFTRYFQLLSRSFQVVRSKPEPSTDEDHRELFGLAADLSMLRLFEAFLESVPQLLLQLYILLLGHGHTSVLQSISMAFSFLNVAWSVVDYRRCLRRSLAQLNEMPRLPTVVYLLYKLFAISTRIFSLSLLLALSPINIFSMVLIWFLGTAWAFVLRTDFCTSKALEVMYRAIIGVILIFTFFNVKGQTTKVPMTVYYIVYFVQSLSAPFLLYVYKPDLLRFEYATAAIGAGLCIGLGLLCLYYAHLHPREERRLAPERAADEVDGMERQEVRSDTTRMRRFLQI